MHMTSMAFRLSRVTRKGALWKYGISLQDAEKLVKLAFPSALTVTFRFLRLDFAFRGAIGL